MQVSDVRMDPDLACVTSHCRLSISDLGSRTPPPLHGCLSPSPRFQVEPGWYHRIPKIAKTQHTGTEEIRLHVYYTYTYVHIYIQSRSLAAAVSCIFDLARSCKYVSYRFFSLYHHDPWYRSPSTSSWDPLIQYSKQSQPTPGRINQEVTKKSPRHHGSKIQE